MAERPMCQVCFADLPDRWRDFDRCIRCQIEADRIEAARCTFTQPSYLSPLDRLDREYGRDE